MAADRSFPIFQHPDPGDSKSWRVDFPIPFELFLIGPALLGGALLLAKVGPALVGAARQRAYDERVAGEMVRWILRVDPQAARDPAAPRRFIAALHPGMRRGLSGWAVGWPQVNLDVVWSGHAATWEIRAPRQLSGMVEAAASAAYPEAELQGLATDDLGRPAHWLALSGSPPDRARGHRATWPMTPAWLSCGSLPPATIRPGGRSGSGRCQSQRASGEDAHPSLGATWWPPCSTSRCRAPGTMAGTSPRARRALRRDRCAGDVVKPAAWHTRGC